MASLATFALEVLTLEADWTCLNHGSVTFV